MAPTIWGKLCWDLTCSWLEPLWAPGVAWPCAALRYGSPYSGSFGVAELDTGSGLLSFLPFFRMREAVRIVRKSKKCIK